MKKLCLLLALLLLLTGCGTNTGSPQSPTDTTTSANQNDISPSVELVRFDIFAINDLHGRLTDTDFQPGVDELSAYLKQAQQAENTILLSTGDMWQGTSEANLTGGFIITEWMNELDFAAMTLGGHEYDWGEEQIRKNSQLAEFPFLGINVYNRQTDRQADYCQSSLMVEADGVQIGIIGAIGDCYASIAAEHTKDVYFKTGAELTVLVKAESEKLRSQGADFIIYCIHDGHDETYNGTSAMTVESQDLADYYDTALSEGYVDLVFEADTHYSYVLMDQHDVYHLQAGGNNQGISHAIVLIDKTSGNASVMVAELVSSGKYSHLQDDPVVAQLLEKYAEQIAPATQVLGNNRQYRSNYALCQLVAKLYCDKGTEKWGEEYDIVLGGGYIACRSPGYMNTGQVTYSQLQSLLPFDNQITLCSIQGRDLISKFLETDHHAYHIQTTPYGESIRNRIDPDATYYVVTDRYTSDYAYNNMTIVDTYDPNIFARDLLAEYIAAGGLD